MIVLDTNVVSETMRPVPEPGVIDRLNCQEIATLHLTAISLAELRYGIACLEPGRRRDDLEARLHRMLAQVFPGRVLGFTEHAAGEYAARTAEARRRGLSVGFADGAIAAVAAAGFTVASRDVAPFEALGINVVDPWAVA